MRAAVSDVLEKNEEDYKVENRKTETHLIILPHLLDTHTRQLIPRKSAQE